MPRCKSSPIKPRSRRTKAEIDYLRGKIYNLLDGEHPMTVRQVFYRLVGEGVIPKTESAYQNSIVRQLGLMRRAGEIPFGWIADNTRWMRKPQSDTSARSMLERSVRCYRQALWDNQHSYVEIWLEKDALSGVVYDVTFQWDVPLMVTRGYPSLSFLYSAAEAVQVVEKPVYLYYFGDLDPSGLDIPRKIEHDLREFAPDAEIHFERVAVTRDQVEEYDLPTRPTKKTDSRSNSFLGESVELDAIPPATLREMIQDCIVRHIDADVLEHTEAVEAAERETLENILLALEGGQ